MIDKGKSNYQFECLIALEKIKHLVNKAVDFVPDKRDLIQKDSNSPSS